MTNLTKKLTMICAAAALVVTASADDSHALEPKHPEWQVEIGNHDIINAIHAVMLERAFLERHRKLGTDSAVPPGQTVVPRNFLRPNNRNLDRNRNNQQRKSRRTGRRF